WSSTYPYDAAGLEPSAVVGTARSYTLGGRFQVLSPLVIGVAWETRKSNCGRPIPTRWALGFCVQTALFSRPALIRTVPFSAPTSSGELARVFRMINTVTPL